MLKEIQEENETRLALLALKRMTRKRKPKQAAEPGQRKPQPRRQPKAAASKRDKPVDNGGGSSRSRESSVESQADQAVEAAAGQGSAPVVPPPALVGPHPVRQNRRRVCGVPTRRSR